MSLYRFGGETTYYDFRSNNVKMHKWKDNFAELRTETRRLPGLSGEYDEQGLSSVAPTKKGVIRVQMTLRAYDGDVMESLRDALDVTATWGKQRLSYRPQTYPTLAERFCWARVASIDMPRDEERFYEMKQAATVVFEATDPRWLVDLAASAGQWENATWNTSTWGEAQQTFAASGLQTDLTFQYNGTAPAEVRVEIETSGSQAVNNPRVQRVAAGAVAEELRYDAAIGASSVLVMDAQRQQVFLDWLSAYNSNFKPRTASWLTLVPGSNTIRAAFDAASNAATVRLYHYEAYR